jgi:predicted outer membrane repeat protein
MASQHQRSFLRLSIAGLLGALALTTGAHVAHATERYVSPRGSDAAGCANVNNPCLTMQYAVAAASDGDTIWVLEAKKKITVDARNVVIDKDLVIVGAGLTPRILTAGGSGRHFEIRPGADVRLMNLSLENGSASDGGSIANAGTLLIYRSVLQYNQATGRGGAILNRGDLRVNDTNIMHNDADEGGGIANEEGATLVVSNTSWLSDNEAVRGGGAISLAEWSGNVMIMDSELSSSRAGTNGGAIEAWGGSLSINDTELRGNTAGSHGGAIYSNVETVLSRARVEFNAATMGGAILFNDGDHRVSWTTFSFNHSSQTGGAIAAIDGTLEVAYAEFDSNYSTTGGAISRNGHASHVIEASYFVENHAGLGGAIAEESLDPAPVATVFDSTFEANRATDSALPLGGAVYINAPSPGQFTNCTFFGNSADAGRGGTIYAASSVANRFLANVTIANSSADEGGAIYADASFLVQNSIITTTDINIEACAGLDLTGEGNLVGNPNSDTSAYADPTCGTTAFSMIGVYGLDAALADNGGPLVGVDDTPLPTLALVATNNATGKGNSQCELPGGIPLPFDQRGEVRPGGNDGCDVGAYELQ